MLRLELVDYFSAAISTSYFRNQTVQ